MNKKVNKFERQVYTRKILRNIIKNRYKTNKINKLWKAFQEKRRKLNGRKN